MIIKQIDETGCTIFSTGYLGVEKNGTGIQEGAVSDKFAMPDTGDDKQDKDRQGDPDSYDTDPMREHIDYDNKHGRG